MLVLMLLRTLILSFSLIATACTSMVIGGGQTAGEYEQHDGRTLEQIESDANITQAAQRVLRHYKAVDVNTANGIVTLQGSVASEYDIHRVINQVYKIDGVKRVESYLRVSTP